MRPAHLLFILFIDICWAMNIIAVKLAVDAVDPLAAATLRYAIVLLVTFPFLRWVKGRMSTIVVTGLIAGAAFMLCINLSMAVTQNVAALAIAGQLGVPFSLLLAVLFLKERIRWVRITGTALAFAGIVLMGFDPAIWAERLGVAITALASMFWAIGSLLFRKLEGVSVLNIHGWLALVSIPCLALASVIFEPGAFARAVSAPPDIFGWIAFSAIFSSLIGHAGMSWLLQRYDIQTIVPLTLPTPLLSAGVAVAWFDTPVTTGLIFGAVVSFVGVAIITLRSAKKEPDLTEELVARPER